MNDRVLWYRARSILLGLDHYTKSYERAYQVAKQSNHPDAQWLCKLFDDYQFLQNPQNLCILPNPENDPRLECFQCIEFNNWAYLKDNPYPLAQVWYAIKSSQLINEHIDDPFAWFYRGESSFQKIFFKRYNSTKLRWYKEAQELYLKAAELGHNEAIIRHVTFCTGFTVIKWLSKIVFATGGNYYQELQQRIFSYPLSSLPQKEVKIFWTRIGKLYVKLKKHAIKYDMCGFIGMCILVYNENVRYTQYAITCWLLCANRLNLQSLRILLNRDIRRKIGLLIWKNRKEGLYA